MYKERERDEIILNLFITEIHEENVPRSGEAFATKIFKLSLASKKLCYNTGACKVRVIRVNLSLKRSF